MVKEITIRWEGVSYVRNPDNPSEIVHLLRVKGMELAKALPLAEACSTLRPGQRLREAGFEFIR